MMMFRASQRTFTPTLKKVLQQKIAEQNAIIKTLRKDFGNEVLSKSTLDACYQGTRGVTTMVYEPSLLDAHEGIRFRGLTIPECQEALPKFGKGTEMMPEAMMWLLLTGDVPTAEQTKELTDDLFDRATNAEGKEALAATYAALDAMPKDLHPMSQLVAASAIMNKWSTFARRYSEGMKKGAYWEACLEDSLSLMARIAPVAAHIYNRTYRNGAAVPALDKNLDWTGNFVQGLGYEGNSEFSECMRLYLAIHVDHEGGNVSAHTTQLVGSALSDPYLSFSAGMAGLAGPLHGLANQEVLLFLTELLEGLDKQGLADAPRDAKKDALTKMTWELLNSGRVVPGYGHAVLRKTDPRYSCQRDYCLRHNFGDFKLFQLVDIVYEIMPTILTEHGKTKNPFPNVDAHSGVLLQYYKLTQQDYYTVLFGVSRALGVLSALVWNRACGIPIERPKSVTTESLLKQFAKKE